MTRKHIKEQLQHLRHTHDRINPDSAWVVRNRTLLLQQINNTVGVHRTFVTSDERTIDRCVRFLSRSAHLFLPKNILVVGRSAFALFLVLAVTVSGWIATVSATNSLPGEPLYQVKLAREKTELIVISVVGTE